MLINVITEDQLELCRREGYHWPRLIRGRICAIHRFMTTVGVLFGIDPDPMGVMCERRYCFAEPSDAYAALEHWTRVPELLHAPGRWQKVKGAIKRDADGRGVISLDNRPQDLWAAMRRDASSEGAWPIMKQMDRLVPVPESQDAEWAFHESDGFEFPAYVAPLSNLMAANPLLYRGY